MRVGFQQMSGEDLANPAGQETDILLVLGHAGREQPDRAARLPASRRGRDAGGAARQRGGPDRAGDTLGGQIVYSSARPRELYRADELSRAFFEYLDEPILLIMTGRCTFEEDVTAEILKQKLGGIILTGRMTAPRAVVPLIQALTLAKTGRIRPATTSATGIATATGPRPR